MIRYFTTLCAVENLYKITLLLTKWRTSLQSIVY